MTENRIAQEFFDASTRALLDRDATGIAGHYAVPDQLVRVEDGGKIAVLTPLNT